MIMIGTKYRVRRLDEQNVVVERGGVSKEGKNAGTWQPSRIVYFPSFKLAVDHLMRVTIADILDEEPNVDELSRISKRIEEIRVELIIAVSEINAGKSDEITGEIETEEEVEA